MTITNFLCVITGRYENTKKEKKVENSVHMATLFEYKLLDYMQSFNASYKDIVAFQGACKVEH